MTTAMNPVNDQERSVHAKDLERLSDALLKLGKRKWARVISDAAACAGEGDPIDAVPLIRDITGAMYDAANDPGKRRHARIDRDDERFTKIYEELDRVADHISEVHAREI